MIADAELVDEGDDLAVALEEVVVEALERRTGNREGVRLPAKALPAFPERYPVAALGQPQRGGEAGDTAADDRDTFSWRIVGGVRRLNPHPPAPAPVEDGSGGTEGDVTT
jgi:hypothetical protein